MPIRSQKNILGVVKLETVKVQHVTPSRIGNFKQENTISR